jgi:hypothetical protein
MNHSEQLKSLLKAFRSSPHPSYKVTNYFPIYVELFGHLVGNNCTFIETGILNGGSLFMWRSWLGPKARIIGVDLNPAAKKWEADGFEIFIGDQGDPKFWREILEKIGEFDALLDDGGHQSFQQMVTLTEAIKKMNTTSVIVIEDTLTSHMRDFSDHGSNSFLEYAKDSTDLLSARNENLWPGQYPKLRNQKMIDYFSSIYSITFYTGLVAFKKNPYFQIKPQLIWNKRPDQPEVDFRNLGSTKSADVLWPDPFSQIWVKVHGQD